MNDLDRTLSYNKYTAGSENHKGYRNVLSGRRDPFVVIDLALYSGIGTWIIDRRDVIFGL